MRSPKNTGKHFIKLTKEKENEMKQYQEIADMDNVTRQAVYGRCKRFIEKMKKLLLEHGITF